MGGVGGRRSALSSGGACLRNSSMGCGLLNSGRSCAPKLVLPTIAGVLGLAEAGPATPERLVAALASKNLCPFPARRTANM